MIESTVQNDTKNHPYDIDELARGLENLKIFNTSFIFSKDLVTFIGAAVIPFSQEKVREIENKEMKLSLIVLILTAAWFIRFVKQQFKQWEQLRTSHSGSNSMSNISSGSAGSGNYEITASPVELEDGTIKVGNISFNPVAVGGSISLTS